MPTLIIAVLIVLAVGVLVSNWMSARRDRDPASSVQTFSRAMDAMGGSSAGASSMVRTLDSSDEHDHEDGMPSPRRADG